MESAAGRILIVDDDEALLKLMAAYLTRLGYSVDACPSAEEAWALVEANPSTYSQALVDLNMKGMRGEELARRILACYPSIRLVVVSGDSSELCRADTPGGARAAYLPKPFTPKQLIDAVR